MTNHTSTPVSETVADRFDRTMPSLSPDVRSVAFDALEPVDYSCPVALCRTTGAAVSSARLSEQALETITVAIEALQGYVQLRSELLEHDRDGSSADRDAAILAGDYLHAFAHASIGDLSIDDTRQIELFRVLTAGSNTLARSYLEPSSGAERTNLDGFRQREPELSETTPAASTPDATLAAVAAELGATVVGAPETVRESVRTYGYSLSRALTIASLEPSNTPDPSDTSDECPRSIAIRVLSGRSATETADAPPTANRGGPATETEKAPNRLELLERELASARTALETVDAVDQSAEATNHRGSEHAGWGDQHPRERLERATRIPFEDVLVFNE